MTTAKCYESIVNCHNRYII